MRRLGLKGVVRGKATKTTVPLLGQPRPLDLVNRQFNAPTPNRLWPFGECRHSPVGGELSDFTYAASWRGFVYAAFVIDAYARKIVGWRVSTSMTAELVLDAIAARQDFPSDIGVVSIDIDSCDYAIFEKMRVIKPSILVIEFNWGIPADIDYHDDPAEPLLRHSAKALARLGREKGFRIVACVGPNVILLREDLIDEGRRGAIPGDMPVEAFFDYAYARRRRLMADVIRCKEYATRPFFDRNPSWSERLIFRLYHAGM